MRINLSKKEYINKLFVHAMYYWLIGDKFNSRNALAAAVILVKDLETDKPKAKILAIDFPTKKAAAS
jgi:hypothetical protein